VFRCAVCHAVRRGRRMILKCMYYGKKSYMPRTLVEKTKMKTTLCDSCGAKLDKKYGKVLVKKYGKVKR